MNKAVAAVVSVATKNLDNNQLITVALVGALGTDPRKNASIWPAAEPLFTETGFDNIPAMHHETRQGVEAELRRREIWNIG